MAYNSPNYLTTIQERVVSSPSAGISLGAAVGTGTATYTGTAGKQGVTGAYCFPVFKNPIIVEGIRVYTVTAPGGGISGLQMTFLNGTSTIGTAVVATASASYVDAVLTGSATLNAHGIQSGAVLFTGTSSNEILMLTTATQTATASTLGTYAIDLIYRNLFTV